MGFQSCPPWLFGIARAYAQYQQTGRSNGDVGQWSRKNVFECGPKPRFDPWAGSLVQAPDHHLCNSAGPCLRVRRTQPGSRYVIAPEVDRYSGFDELRPRSSSGMVAVFDQIASGIAATGPHVSLGWPAADDSYDVAAALRRERIKSRAETGA